MLTDYFLKFASKEEAIQVFSTIPEPNGLCPDLVMPTG